MLANRLVLVIVALVILVHADDSRSEIDTQQDGISVVSKTTSTNERRRVEKEVNADGRRQGRMALHTEAPSSKAKREQALRSILAARRRRYQGSRLTEVSKTPRIPKPVLSVAKDSLDMLEAEETRHGVYVTAPIGDEVSLLMGNDEDDDNLEFVSKENLSKLTTVILKMPVEKSSPIPPENIEAIINETQRNQSSSRSHQIVEHENRRKNIVAMPESLYNHFRPVESNIPVEDMSQFLYFGQKLHPDVNSSRSNNSIVDATSTSSSVTSSRRRYSKRFSTTTPLPVPRLEDMINEEMNIAIERGTVERNKIPKVKNVFRSPGSGVYFRKSSSRTTYPTIVSNVIPTTDATSRNSSSISLSDNKRETVLSGKSGKSIVVDPSAHANLDQVANPETGSYTRLQKSVNSAHDSTTENSADLTQFDEVSRNNETFESTENDDDDDKIQAEQSTLIKVIDENVSQSDISGMKIVSSTSRDATIDGITTWQTIQSHQESTTTTPSNETVKMTQDQENRESKSNFPTTNLGHSSLRIVVTEPIGHVTVIPKIGDTEESTVTKEESIIHKRKETPDITRYRGEARYTVNLADSTSNDYFQISKNPKILPTVVTSFLPPNATNPTPISLSPIVQLSSTSVTSKPSGTSAAPLLNTIKREQKHIYAYEITNVTRLLRNYSGPGPNKVENGTTKNERRRNESGREVYEARRKETMTETDQLEEKRKSGINKKQKLVDQLDRIEVRDKSGSMEGEEVRVKVVERGPALTRTSGNSSSSSSSIREIRNGGRSVQSTSERPLPLLLLLLPTTPRSEASSSASGETVKEERTPDEVSAGADVGEVTASISGDVGVSRYDSSTIEVNISTIADPENERITTSSSSTENSLGISTLRWNHTLHDRIPKNRTDIRSNERRYLRKSSSAVLNQRKIEDSLIKEVKRRRGTSSNGVSVYASNFNNRRNKVWRNDDKVRTTSLTRSMENRTSVITIENDSLNDTVIVDTSEDAIGQRMENVTEVSATMTEIEIEVTTIPSINEDRMESSSVVNDDTGTTILTPSTLESPIKVSEVKDYNRTSGATSVKVNDDLTRKIEKPANASDATSVDSTSLTLTPLARSSENEEIVTTSATPGFPVTPMMLPPEQSSTVNKSDEVTEVSEVKIDEDEKSEANRPFGVAKDLDPSEIQKRYRSQTTLKPEQAMTTILPEIDEISGTRERSRTASPMNSSVTRKPVGVGERSPEVRGRNLSDKDKDDVLPIMELYNTSRIFNGTNEDSANAPRKAELPDPVKVNETRHVNEPVSSKEDTVTTTTTTTTAKTTTMVNGESPKNERKNDRRQDEPITTRKNNGRQSESRQETNDYSTSTRSSNNGNFYNNTQMNRTRNRPSYYHTQQPEFVGYRPEVNGSFYEPGLISVSPRESINISEVITKRHDGDNIATQETVAVVSYILATLVVFPIAVGVGLILRRLIIRNRKVLEESDTSSEISCRKDALNLENGDFKTSIEKAITKLPRIQYLCHEAEKPPPPPSQESRWEFPRDKLRLQTVLGQGNFGQVWKAEADDLTGHQGTTRLVAVKTVKEGASAREKEDLVRELEIMQQLGNHPNVVTLLGCCTEDEPHYLILEYVMYGKLLAYLRDHRTRQDFYNFSEDSAALTSRDLTVFGYCVARGMEYLASKKIIHRDLAARNVLVDHNKLCKIADFGMSRFANDEGEIIEARHGRNALPIRWMAPESLIYSLFTTKTDVWSFGILMWEIVTLGSTPYPDMAAREVMRNVQNGYRLERPSHCRSELFRVIARCWHADPDRRPEFQTLRRDMAQLLEDGMNGHYVDLESFASECTD